MSVRPFVHQTVRQAMHRSLRQVSLLAALVALLAAVAMAQSPKAVAYPERDALSPFRNPTETYAPPANCSPRCA
jgi:hypothetical protein